jgi:hypothetical protein
MFVYFYFNCAGIFFLFLVSFTDAFELGTEREFSFVNDVNLHELKLAVDHTIGHRISGNLKVSSVYGDHENGYLLRFVVSR